MTITVDIRPDAGAELAREAAAQGVEIETYVARLVEDAAAHLPASRIDRISHAGAKDMVELFAPLRGLNLDFERDRDTGRYDESAKSARESHRFPTAGDGRRLQDWLDIDVRAWYAGRILPVTEAIAERWGYLASAARQQGLALAVVDSVIAATALHHDLTVVTRNVKDFAGLGVGILNPWEM